MTSSPASTRRVALVTGGSQGLGLALVRRLVQDGWLVITDARRGERLAAAAAGLPRNAVHAIPGDVADPDHREQLVLAVRAAGRLDLLVHNASALGPSPLPPLAAHPLDELEQVYRVNVFAPLALTQPLLPDLRHSRGVLIMISSDAAAEAYPGWGGYGSSKAALDQLAAVLAVELPELHVYAVDPGDMNTEMHQRAFPGEDISDRPAPEAAVPALLRLVEQDVPSGRYRAADLLDRVDA